MSFFASINTALIMLDTGTSAMIPSVTSRKFMGLVTDAEITTKIESPLNLFNRLRNTTSRKDKESLIVSIPPPKTDDLIDDLESKIANPRAKALSIMSKALTRLDSAVEIIDPKKLPSLIKDMGLTVKNLEPERKEAQNVQFIVYSPQLMSEDEFGTPIVVEDK